MNVSADVLPRLGFVGLGWIGSQRRDALVDSGTAEAVAACDPAVDGCLESFDDLLELDLDGLVIATPNALHAPQAIAALDHGIAVFCQKPLGVNADEARAVLDAARRNDRLLGVDMSYRLTEAARSVRELVQSDRLGDVFAVDLAFHNAYGPDRPWSTDPSLAGGGCLVDLGVHLVDLALWTLDFPPVRKVTGRLRGRPLEDHAFVQLDLVGGTVVRIACSWRLHLGGDCLIEACFYGTEGGASLRNVGGSFFDLRAERYDGTATTVLCEPPDAWPGRAAVAWAQRLATGAGFDAAADQLVPVHEVLDAVYGETGP
jgi:predicted dehydrogenase